MKRRRNVIIKGVEVKEGRRKEKVERILDAIGAKVEKKIRRIGEGTERERKGRMLLVKLGSEEQKWDIMGKKKILRGREKNCGGPDVEEKENKMESKRNSEERESDEEKSMGEWGEDKDRGKVVKMGRGGGSVER